MLLPVSRNNRLWDTHAALSSGILVPTAKQDDLRSRFSMVDLFVGIAFLVILFSPAIVAIFSETSEAEAE